jgi:hypothetical protein
MLRRIYPHPLKCAAITPQATGHFDIHHWWSTSAPSSSKPITTTSHSLAFTGPGPSFATRRFASKCATPRSATHRRLATALRPRPHPAAQLTFGTSAAPPLPSENSPPAGVPPFGAASRGRPAPPRPPPGCCGTLALPGSACDILCVRQ